MAVVAPRWETLACDDAAEARLAEELRIPLIVARLLCQRGLGDAALASRFLNPTLYYNGGAAGQLTADQAAGAVIMGTVDQTPARFVAIEIVVTSATADPEALERYLGSG